MEITNLFQNIFNENGIALAFDKNENLLYFYNKQEMYWQDVKTEVFLSSKCTKLVNIINITIPHIIFFIVISFFYYQ